MTTTHAATGQVGQAGSPVGIRNLKEFGIYGEVTIGIDNGDYPHRPEWQWCSCSAPSIRQSKSDESACNESSASRNMINSEQGTNQKLRNFVSRYGPRIEYLKQAAAQDGYALNMDSEANFRQFVLSVSGIREGDLVLIDNGNLRAVWKDGQGNRIGLQFLGGEMVQYVIFRRREPEQPMSRVAGRDSFDGVLRQINAFDLDMLLCE